MDFSTQRVLAFLQENIQRPIRMEELAEVACLSSVQLYRIFKQETGLTPIQYGEMLKIKTSTEWLQSECDVQEIAYQLGYANYETFSRSFKKICSLAPSEFQAIFLKFKSLMGQNDAMLVKEDATIYEVHQLWKESTDNKVLVIPPEDLEIYRIRTNSLGRRTRNTDLKFDLVKSEELTEKLIQFIEQQ